MTDLNAKLARLIPMSKTLPMHAASICLDHWIDPFDILTYLLTDNGSQLVSKLFTLVGKH